LLKEVTDLAGFLIIDFLVAKDLKGLAFPLQSKPELSSPHLLR
jgi:hypothetical protein